MQDFPTPYIKKAVTRITYDDVLEEERILVHPRNIYLLIIYNKLTWKIIDGLSVLLYFLSLKNLQLILMPNNN